MRYTPYPEKKTTVIFDIHEDTPQRIARIIKNDCSRIWNIETIVVIGGFDEDEPMNLHLLKRLLVEVESLKTLKIDGFLTAPCGK